MLEWRNPEKRGTGAGRGTTAEILARRRRVRRMLGRSERETAPCRGRRRRLAGSWRLGCGGTSWGRRKRGNPGSVAKTEQICPQVAGKKYGRASDCCECGHGAAGVRVGSGLQSAARRAISHAVLEVWGKTGDRVEQSGRLRRSACEGGRNGARGNRHCGVRGQRENGAGFW